MRCNICYLPWEAKVGGPAQFRWMYSQERELKKLRVTVCNKARVEGCIADAFICKEITNFSSKYFSCANNVNAHTMRYHIVEEVLLNELSIFQWKGAYIWSCLTRHQIHFMSFSRTSLAPLVFHFLSCKKNTQVKRK
jgi:hypothetical protein